MTGTAHGARGAQAASGDPTAFGPLLKRFRRGQGGTQQELAATAGYSAVYVGMLERGERVPSVATAKALAAALALDAHQRATLLAAARTPQPHAGSRAAGSTERLGARLVGRARELKLLQRQLAGDAPALLALVGEPGIGKTRLLQEVVQRAPAEGWRVLAGGSHLLNGAEPFTPVLGALERYLQTLPPAQLQGALDGCGWLVRLLPEVAELGIASPPDWRLAPEQERRLIFKAVRRFLTNVAGPAGTLLVLDDLQWASRDALDLLAHLLRAPMPHEAPLRVVVAARSTEMVPEEPLGVLLLDLIRAGSAAKLELGPLTRDEAAELLRSMLGDGGDGGDGGEGDAARAHEQEHLVEQVLRRAGGIPLFLVSYAQALGATSPSSGRAAVDTVEAVEAIPRDVVDGMRQRVAALPTAAQELLAVAATVGLQIPRMLLMRLLQQQGQREGDVLAALEAACRARLLVEEGDGAYGFSHDLVREALLADLSTGRRALLHRWVAEALEHAVPAPSAEELAFHFARAGAFDRSVWYLERAGDHALALRAHSEAASAYRELTVQLDALDRHREAARAREKLGMALLTTAQYDAALAALQGAVATYRTSHDHAGLVRAMTHIGEVHALRGTSEEGIRHLEPLLALASAPTLSAVAEDGPTLPGRAALYVTLAWLVNTTGRYSEALRLAHQAAELAGAAADPALLLQANLRRGHLLLMLEQVNEGVRVLEEAIPQAEAVGDLRGLRFALNSLGWIHELRGHGEQDQAYTDRAFAVAEQLDDPTVLAFMRSNRGSPAFNRGDWPQARADFEAGLALMRQVSVSWASAWPPLLLGQLCLAEGQREHAEELLEEAIGVAEQNQDLEAQRWAHGTLAECDLLAAAPEQVIARLHPLRDRPGQRELDVCALLPLLARAYAELGQLDEAEVVAGDAYARASAAGLQPTVASALHAQAAVAQRRGQWEQAEAQLEQALAVSRGIRQPYGEAKVLYALALLHLHQGERDAARRALVRARLLLTRLREHLYLEQVNRVLAGLVSPARKREAQDVGRRQRAPHPHAPRVPQGRPR